MRNLKPIDYTSKAIAYFLELNERKLTEDIIMPLLKTMGFIKVDYHGGQCEKGKDLILWRYDELDEIELINVQVKIWKPSPSSSSTQSFAGVVTQLQQASEEHVEHLNGQKYLPSAVYFITPYEVDARSLSARFNKYSDLSHRRIRIIDGTKLASLVKKSLPNLANEILGVKFAMQTVIKSKLNNLTLLRALDYSSEKNISRFYSDLELTFGDMTTNAFLNSQLDTSQHIQHIHTSDWPEFKSICLKLTSRYKHRLTIQSIATLDRKYHEILKTSININKGSLNTFSIRINTNSLKRFFNKQKVWLKQQEKILNYEKTTINDCKNTFVECHKLLKFINELVSHDLMNGIFKLERTIPTKIINNSSLRICSPINKIFGTQLNIAILGDAGAGKTTCLQMQAQQELEKGSNKLVLFIPLAQVTPHNIDKFTPSENERSPKVLIKLLVKFFHTENVDLSDDELDKLLQDNDSLLLFDGIDEVISKTPWILSSISLLSDLYPRSQIIISSRTGGGHLNNIKFLSLVLLPFTNKQRDYFINEWFDNKKDPRIKLIIDHVNNNTALKEIIKKPILATIMCVLAEHDVPLPKSELRLYHERMKLLTGHYDLHKQINRTKSTQDLLEKVARKLAFALHQSQIREDHIDNLIQIAVHALTPEECTKTLVTQAVKELQYPCNVLLPTSHDNQLGFGLLRYQEYLVAQELFFNRSIPLKQFYNSTWWKEVMVIFVKMSGDPDYILKDILSTSNVTSSTDTFFAITATLPHVEKMKYEALITDAIKRESDMKQRSSSR